MHRDTAPSITQLKINAAGIDENLFRLVHVSGLDAQVLRQLLPLELVSKFGLGHQQNTRFRLVHLPFTKGKRTAPSSPISSCTTRIHS